MAALTSEADGTAKQPIGWLRGPWGVASIIAALYSAVHVIWSFAHWGGEASQAAISDVAFLPISLFAALAAFRIWNQPGVEYSTRLAWGLLGLGLLANFFGDLLWFYYEIILQSEPFPSWADLGYLAFYPLMMLALLKFPYSPVSRSDQQRLYLDSAIVLMASWMVNLMDNAFDAITSPGTITLNASRHADSGLILNISDTGTGMSEEVLAHASDPFYTTKPTGEGTGLGLSICRGIVRAHDGQMTIESRPGQGAQVTITLPPEPLAHPVAARVAEAQPPRTQAPPY